MESIYSKSLWGAENEEIQMSKLSDMEFILIYFSASFCPPSKPFTEMLITFYQESNIEKQILEIIQVTFDTQENEYKKFMEKIPWPRYPIFDSKGKELTARYEVTGIPRLVVLNSNLDVIAGNAWKDLIMEGMEVLN